MGPYARGSIFGITRGTTRAHIARATIESIVFQTRDVVESMSAASGVKVKDLRVDGGAAVIDFMLQLQADHLGVAVLRPKQLETTAMGAGFWRALAKRFGVQLVKFLRRGNLTKSLSQNLSP